MEGITLTLAGAFGISGPQRPEAVTAIGSRKARRLLLVLAAHRGHVVPPDRLIDLLWLEKPPQRPVENVATLVSRLRATLGPECIVGGRDGYRLGSPPALTVDLDEAARFAAEARRRLARAEPALAWTAATRALDILAGGVVLVDEPAADWVEALRLEGSQLLRLARHLAATAALEVDDPPAARELAQRAVGSDPYDEEAHRLLMRALVAAGEPATALAVYESLRQRLADELGVDPSPQTRDLYVAVIREQHPPEEPSGKFQGQARDPTELPGRSREQSRLRTAWAAASGGHPGLVLLAGEAGIGKTRLATELVAEAQATGGLVLQSRCYDTERGLFLQPVVDALAIQLTGMRAERLREFAGPHTAALAHLIPELAPQLALPTNDRADGSASPDVELRRTFEAVASVLRGLADERAVLLVLDDLHNAGLATLELLHYLVRRVNGARLLVLATVRAEEGSQALDALHDVSDRIDLEALPADAVTALAREAGQADLAESILQRTRGHTLFVVETLRGLAAGDPAIPDTLQDAVLARLRRAGGETEELLRAGAVLGDAVDPMVLAALLDVTPQVAARRCAQALRSRLLVAAEREYEFANDLVREVVYESTPYPTRLAYHRQAADLLTSYPESVARHAAAAEDWPRAARAFLLAGEQAARRYAAADADALLTRGLEVAQRIGDSEVLGRIYVARGRVRSTLGSYRSARGDLQAAAAAARQSGDARLKMIALRELGYDSAYALGVPVSETSAHLRAALQIADSLGDRAMQADLLSTSAILSANRLRFTEALRLARRAVEMGKAAHDDRALAMGLDGLKTAYAYLGELADLASVLDDLEPVLHRLGDLFRLQWTIFETAFLAVGAADWDSATIAITEAIAMNERSEYVAGRAWFVAHLGWVARLQGDLDRAARHGADAVDLSRRSTHGWWGSTAESMFAGTLLELGRRDEAVDLLTDARRALEVGGLEAYLLRCLAPLAEATGSRAVLDEAMAVLDAMVTPTGCAWLLGVDAYLALARAWLGHQEPARARAVLAPMMAAAARNSWVPIVACGSLVDGMAAAALGEADEARRLLRAAEEVARRHHMPLIAGHARDALGRI